LELRKLAAASIPDLGSAFGRADAGSAFGRADAGSAFGRADAGSAFGRADVGSAFGRADTGSVKGRAVVAPFGPTAPHTKSIINSSSVFLFTSLIDVSVTNVRAREKLSALILSNDLTRAFGLGFNIAIVMSLQVLIGILLA